MQGMINRLPKKTRQRLRHARRNATLLANRLQVSRRPLPDFVIIGAQKAGTTFLETYLGLPAFEEFEQSNDRSRQLRLDLAITEMSPGIAALRLFGWLTVWANRPTGLGRVTCLAMLPAAPTSKRRPTTLSLAKPLITR